MQNKTLFVLLSFVLLTGFAVSAQTEGLKDEMPKTVESLAPAVKTVEKKADFPVIKPVVPEEKKDITTIPNAPLAKTESALDVPSKESLKTVALEKTANKEALVDKKVTTRKNIVEKPLSEEAVRNENKKRIEEELKNTSVVGKDIVDFPNRSSLGSLELAPLPGYKDTNMDGPLPMAKSVSGKDLPSEQLLGRITPEVFQEMADIERGNTFLKLQLEKEKLKNDLEKLKSTYRQQRLDEIAKREDVVRTRIQWWQDQEDVRLEIAKKQAEEEELNRKIAEQEATRNRLREEALQRQSDQKSIKPITVEDAVDKSETPTKEISLPSMEELYVLISVRGIGSDLTARLKSKADEGEITVKKDDILPSGHVVKEIKKDLLMVSYGNRIDQLILRPITQ